MGNKQTDLQGTDIKMRNWNEYAINTESRACNESNGEIEFCNMEMEEVRAIAKRKGKVVD